MLLLPLPLPGYRIAGFGYRVTGFGDRIIVTYCPQTAWLPNQTSTANGLLNSRPDFASRKYVREMRLDYSRPFLVPRIDALPVLMYTHLG